MTTTLEHVLFKINPEVYSPVGKSEVFHRVRYYGEGIEPFIQCQRLRYRVQTEGTISLKTALNLNLRPCRNCFPEVYKES